MKRTESENQSKLIPDIVNKTIQTGFTQVPNAIGRSPDISGKAFKILFILASNQKGWKNYREKLYEMMQEGYTAIDTALKELQNLDLLRKIRYRQIDNKQMAGSFWAVTFTPGMFENLSDQKALLQSEGLEIFPSDDYSKETHPDGNHSNGSYPDGNQILRIPNKEKQKKNINNTPDPSGSEESNIRETSSNGESKKKPSPKDRNKKFIPLSKHLAKTIDEYPINYKINQKKIKSWSNDLRLLHEVDGVPVKEIKTALKWYRKNIGGEFVPEIFSGSAFRQKWIKLQAAIKRGSSKNGQPKISTAYHRKDGHQYKTNKKI